MYRNEVGRLGLEHLEERMVPTPTGTITGTIWRDIDHDGYKETGDDAITFYHVVYLLDSTLNVIAQTTAINGQYAFIDLEYDTYWVRFNLPSGYEVSDDLTTDNQFYTDDAGRAVTNQIVLSAFNKNPVADAGIWIDS